MNINDQSKKDVFVLSPQGKNRGKNRRSVTLYLSRKLKDGMQVGQMHNTLRDVGRLAGGYFAGGILTEQDMVTLEELAVSLAVNSQQAQQKWRDAVKFGQQAPIGNGGGVTRSYSASEITEPISSYDAKGHLTHLINSSAGCSVEDIMELSPHRVNPAAGPHHTRDLLGECYAPDARVYIDDRFPVYPSHLRKPDENLSENEKAERLAFKLQWQTEHTKSAQEWIEIIRQQYCVYPHIVPNPLSGEERMANNGVPSRRCDNCVAGFNFAIAEHDNLTLQEQLQFWHTVIEKRLLPVAALIYSGSKSIHGWIRVNAKDHESWKLCVEHELFAKILTPMGFDPACKNPSRFSRLPGYYRNTGYWQSLLYLNGEDCIQ